MIYYVRGEASTERSRTVREGENIEENFNTGNSESQRVCESERRD